MNNFKHIGFVNFPEPKDIEVNMLPFIMGDVESLPADLRHYWPLIEACNLSQEQIGKIGYLTIDERQVNKGSSHRRGGIHVEKQSKDGDWGNGSGWGNGKKVSEKIEDGLYVASNINSSCRVWDERVETPGFQGSCDEPNSEAYHLRKNELVWITDSTPHESIPVKEDCYRQFFRLVTHKVCLETVDKHSKLTEKWPKFKERVFPVY